MAGGLYRRGVQVNNATPYQQVAASRGAGGIGGAPVIPPKQEEDPPVDVSKLGGLLGMMRKEPPAGGDAVGEPGFQGGTAGPDAIMNQGSLAQQSGLNGIDFSGGMGNGIGNGMPMGIGAQALQGAPQAGGMGAAGGMLGGMDFSGGMAGAGQMAGGMGGMGGAGMPMGGMSGGMPAGLDPSILQRMGGFGGFGF